MVKDTKKIAPPSLLDETRNLLRRAGLVARKRLGQHFLVDEEVLAKILAAAEVNSGDTIIEVGPGLGILTMALAKRAGMVVAVELDDNLADLLKETLVGLPNVRVINRDILDVEPDELLGDNRHYRVVANLPYYITAPVFRHFLEAKAKPESMVVMVQKEVANNIIAKPGDLSLLALSIQFYAEPKLVTYVPASSFYPAPEIDSAVLRLEIRPRPKVEVGNPDRFFGLVKAGFSARRKQLINSLSGGLGKSREEVTAILGRAKIDPKRRAEMLSLEEWAALWRIYNKHNENP
jgi:16S rRNA (adenine1518-N6/adenine1519-N6)-dimethyltransferase